MGLIFSGFDPRRVTVRFTRRRRSLNLRFLRILGLGFCPPFVSPGLNGSRATELIARFDKFAEKSIQSYLSLKVSWRAFEILGVDSFWDQFLQKASQGAPRYYRALGVTELKFQPATSRSFRCRVFKYHNQA